MKFRIERACKYSVWTPSVSAISTASVELGIEHGDVDIQLSDHSTLGPVSLLSVVSENGAIALYHALKSWMERRDAATNEQESV